MATAIRPPVPGENITVHELKKELKDFISENSPPAPPSPQPAALTYMPLPTSMSDDDWYLFGMKQKNDFIERMIDTSALPQGAAESFAKLSAEVGAVKTDKKTDFGAKYEYTSGSHFAQACRMACAEVGVSLVAIRFFRTGKRSIRIKDGTVDLFREDCVIILECTKTGGRIFGEGSTDYYDKGDKGATKMQTTAIKYAWRNVTNASINSPNIEDDDKLKEAVEQSNNVTWKDTIAALEGCKDLSDVEQVFMSTKPMKKTDKAAMRKLVDSLIEAMGCTEKEFMGALRS